MKFNVENTCLIVEIIESVKYVKEGSIYEEPKRFRETKDYRNMGNGVGKTERFNDVFEVHSA